MPKNDKKRKNNHKGQNEKKEKQLLLSDGEEQIYGITEKELGDRRFSVVCQDGKKRMARVRGKMNKRQYVRVGDCVLITVRATDNDDKCDIIHVYDNEQTKILRKSGILLIDKNESGELTTGEQEEEKDEPFDFAAI